MNKIWFMMLMGLVLSLGKAPFALGESRQEKFGLPLNLKEAIEAALEHRVEIRLEKTQVQILESKVEESFGTFLPQLTLSANLQNITNWDVFGGVQITGTFGGQPVNVSVTRDIPRYIVDAQLKTTLNLYSGGLSIARLGEARANKKEGEAKLQVTRNNLILEVALAYLELRKSQMSLLNAEHHLDLSEREDHLAAKQFTEGKLSEIGKESKHLRALEQEIEVVQARQKVGDGVRKYRAALGLTVEPDNDGNIEQIGNLADDFENLNIGELLKSYEVKKDPEKLRDQAKLAATYARKQKVQADFYPNVDFFALYDEIGRDPDTLRAAFADFNRQDWALGLELKWNLFDGFQTLRRMAQAYNEIIVSELQLEKTEQELNNLLKEKTLRVKLLENDFVLAKKRLDFSQAQERIAKKRLDLQEITQIQYDLSMLAVEDAKTNLAIANLDLLSAKIVLALASQS